MDEWEEDYIPSLIVRDPRTNPTKDQSINLSLNLGTVLKPLFESNSETPTAPLKIKNAFIVFKFEEEAEDKK